MRDARVSRCLAGAFFSVALFCSSPVFAASVEMEYVLGFNGVFTLNRWTPLNIILENRGRAVSGLLEVVVISGSEYHRNVHDRTYCTDVELPTDSKKLYSFAIFLESFTHPLNITLKSDGKTLISRSLNLRPHYRTRPLVLALGGGIPPDFSSWLPERVIPVISSPRFLPETWYGYHGVEMVIMGAGEWKDLNEKQFDALREWVKGGGYIVTSAGPNYGSFFKERIRHLLPVSVLEWRRVSALNALEGFCGRPLAGQEPFLLLKTEIKGAATLAEEGDTPIILRKDIGLGKIIFLAFDPQGPPFTNWPGRYDFWGKLLELRPEGGGPSLDYKEKEILGLMISNMPLHFPALLKAASFLLLYLVLVLFALRAIGKNKKRRWGHLGRLIIIIVVFSAAGYWLFFYQNSLRQLSHNSLLHMRLSNQGANASMKYLLGLYSLQKAEYRISMGDDRYPVTAIRPDRSQEEVFHDFTLHENDAGQTVSIPLDKWSHRFLNIDAVIDFPLRGEAFLDRQGLVVRIDNQSPHRIAACQIYFAGRFFSFGPISPSRKQVKRLDRSNLEAKALFKEEEAGAMAASLAGDGAASLFPRGRNGLLKDLILSIHSLHKTREDSLHLFGWVDSSILPTRVEGRDIRGGGLTLLEWDIPLNIR